MRKHILSTLMVMFAILVFNPIITKADAAKGDYFISFGADLTEKEKSDVCRNLGITEDDISFSKTITVTNKEEHEYLDSYINKKAIGKRALSSVYIEKTGKGSGIHIETSHITYCTADMYRSALATAGLSDVNVKITGPYDISGTAALVGAMKAYENMSGETLSEDVKDAANDELVTTKMLSEAVGTDKAEKVIMMVKERVAEEDDPNSTDLNRIIDDVCELNNVELTEDQKAELMRLTKKFDELDLDINSIMSQARDIYNGITQDPEKMSVVDRIIGFFKRVFHNFID